MPRVSRYFAITAPTPLAARYEATENCVSLWCGQEHILTVYIEGERGYGRGLAAAINALSEGEKPPRRTRAISRMDEPKVIRLARILDDLRGQE